MTSHFIILTERDVKSSSIYCMLPISSPERPANWSSWRLSGPDGPGDENGTLLGYKTLEAMQAFLLFAFQAALTPKKLSATSGIYS